MEKKGKKDTYLWTVREMARHIKTTRIECSLIKRRCYSDG